LAREALPEDFAALRNGFVDLKIFFGEQSVITGQAHRQDEPGRKKAPLTK
jgi:hypothetical protein